MRRLISTLLVVAILFAGCSGKDKGDTSASSTPFPNIETKNPQSAFEPPVGQDNSSPSQADPNQQIYDRSDGLEGDPTGEDGEASAVQPKKAVAYLNIPGTTINDWVMWAADNNYFLRKDNSENYDFYGCYYMDQDSRVDPLSKNIIVYGHNMDDNPEGRKFAQLMKYTDMEFVDKNQNILFKTPDGVQIYKLISVMYTDHNFNYIISHPSDQNMKDMIVEYKARSLYTCDVPFDETDKYLTLSTCTYKYGKREDQRFVVVGRLIRADETVDTKYTFNPNTEIKEPQWDADLAPIPDNVITLSDPEDDLVEAQTPNYSSSEASSEDAAFSSSSEAAAS